MAVVCIIALQTRRSSRPTKSKQTEGPGVSSLGNDVLSYYSFVKLLQSSVNQTPRCGKFARIKTLFDWIVNTHMIEAIWQNVVPTVNNSFLIARLFLEIVNVPSQTIDVPSVCREPSSATKGVGTRP